MKFSRPSKDVLQKQERRVSDKWHLDEMSLKINGEYFVLWRAVDEPGIELDGSVNCEIKENLFVFCRIIEVSIFV
jgi:transposase-like protein